MLTDFVDDKHLKKAIGVFKPNGLFVPERNPESPKHPSKRAWDSPTPSGLMQ